MLKRTIRILSAVICIVLAAPVCAETYKDIGPLDSLAELKAKFPGASFIDQKPAWAQQNQKLYAIKGDGMAGSIVVLFSDNNDVVENAQRRYAESQGVAPEPFKRSEESLVVEWVRWVPSEAIPLARVIAKYGQPEKSGFSDEDLQPYKSWIKRGLVVYLSDDSKYATRFDYSFTEKELHDTFMKKWGFDPYEKSRK